MLGSKKLKKTVKRSIKPAAVGGMLAGGAGALTGAALGASGLFGFGNDSPPKPPDFDAAAARQAEENRAAAEAAQRLNNPNVIGPGGETQQWEIGPDGRPILKQSLSPEQQAIRASLVGQTGTAANALGGIQGGGSYDDTRKKVIDAMMMRADEDYARQRDQANSELIAAGIRPGTAAYADRMQMIERSRNDARSQAEISGGNAATQAFGVDDTRRKSAVADVGGLMTLGQQNPFALPGVAQNSQVAPAPYFGAATAAGDYNVDVWNTQQQRRAGLEQGLLSLGGTAGAAAIGGRR